MGDAVSAVSSGGTAATGTGGCASPPRIGFLGVGWIGRSRMLSLAQGGVAEVVGAADADSGARTAAADALDGLVVVDDLDALLALGLDGVVIATPSALHAAQATAALQRGVAVYCQKPLARTRAETAAVLTAAGAADRLLAVDLCYRHTDAARALHELVAVGELGEIYAVDVTFHNAYGPDKPWFTQRTLAGGGCLIDLGSHLIDLALWLTGSADATVTAAALRRRGGPVSGASEEVEDYAVAQLELPGGATARLACSWFLPAGRDCVFECTLYGTAGGASMRNRGGSFYDFTTERFSGTTRRPVSAPGEDWGARGIRHWTQRLAGGERFDPAGATELATLAGVLDRIYEAAP
jgi:predicted dehydrogenase